MKKMKAIAFVAMVACLIFLIAFNALAIKSEVITEAKTGFEPEIVSANPKLVNLSKDFEQNICEVTEGVYVAVGYARANPVLIEGTDGLIVIDPAESETAAKIVKAAYNEQLDNIFSKKPVKAIIYTHYHDCHIHGATVFAGNDMPEIIAHENFTKNLFSPPGAVYSLIFPIKAYRPLNTWV